MASESSLITLLDRPVYAMAQADSLLGLHGGTVRRWLEGYSRGGRSYPPVIRPEPTGSDLVTWGEFVEAGLLAAYRHKNVPLQRMRPVVSELRDRTGIPYPLAHFRPLIANRELVLDVQNAVGLEKPLQLVVVRSGQTLLAFEAQGFVDKLEWGDEVAARLHPIGRQSPVVIDPELRFGEPNVRGISTENLVELFESGDDPETITQTYNLTRHELDEAVRFELMRRPSAAA